MPKLRHKRISCGGVAAVCSVPRDDKGRQTCKRQSGSEQHLVTLNITDVGSITDEGFSKYHVKVLQAVSAHQGVPHGAVRFENSAVE